MKPMLSSEELREAQEKINASPTGVFEVSEIFGDDWNTVGNPHYYGKKFFQAASHSLLKLIRYHDRRLDNHRTYLIHR